MTLTPCPICRTPSDSRILLLRQEYDPAIAVFAERRAPTWTVADGICPACLQNFAALYLPEGADGVYDTITPANYFRVIFNQVFDAGYDLLPDLSYDDVDPTDAQDMRIFPETAPHCPTAQP